MLKNIIGCDVTETRSSNIETNLYNSSDLYGVFKVLS